MASRHRRHRNPRPRRNPGDGGGGGTGLLLLLGGAAFLFLTTSGQQLLAGAGVGPAATVPSGLPAGTTQLANGQYRLPNGQIIGPPAPGQQAYAGSNLNLAAYVQTAGAAVGAIASITSLFQRFFGAAPTTAAPPASPPPVTTPAGTLTLDDGSVLQLGQSTPIDLTNGVLGFDSTLNTADLGAAVPMVFDLSSSVADLPTVWPDVPVAFDPSAMAPGFGSLPASRRVGFVPVPMQHG